MGPGAKFPHEAAKHLKCNYREAARAQEATAISRIFAQAAGVCFPGTA